MTNRGFSLVEMSVVLLIIAFIAGTSISLKVYDLNTYKEQQTRKKIEAIKNSLAIFTALNSRLPCPANINLSQNDVNAGKEACGCEVVNSSKSISFACNSDAYIGGAVPVDALNLPLSFLYDGWGNQIFYAVTAGMAGSNSACQYGLPQTLQSLETCDQGIVSIVDINNTDITDGAVYVILSFGQNGQGAWNSNGVKSSVPTNSAELINATATTTGGDFVLGPIIPDYDDILYYQTKTLLLSDSGAFLSKGSCAYAREINQSGANQLCTQDAGDMNCSNFLTTLANKVNIWCLGPH